MLCRIHNINAICISKYKKNLAQVLKYRLRRCHNSIDCNLTFLANVCLKSVCVAHGGSDLQIMTTVLFEIYEEGHFRGKFKDSSIYFLIKESTKINLF